MELPQSTGSDACGGTGPQTAPVPPRPLRTLQWLHTGILMKFIRLGLAFKALSVLGLSVSLPVLVFFLFLEHAIVPSFSRGFSFHGRFRSSQSPFCHVISRSTSLVLPPNAHIINLAPSHHVGISWSHLITRTRVSTGVRGGSVR